MHPGRNGGEGVTGYSPMACLGYGISEEVFNQYIAQALLMVSIRRLPAVPRDVLVCALVKWPRGKFLFNHLYAILYDFLDFVTLQQT